MKYRKFGKTGGEISILGFGCMRLPEKEINSKMVIDEDKAFPLLMQAFENGVNYFDTAPGYCNQNSEQAVGKALKSVRDKVMISTKVGMGGDMNSRSDFRRKLEQSLSKLDTEYIDFYHFWGISKQAFDEKIQKLDLLEEAQKCKEEGIIRHISFSFHDDPENMKYIIDKGEIFETVLCQYNLLDRSNEDSIAYAAQKGLGVVAMGPVAGGRLAAPTDLYTKLTGKEPIATYELALRFVMGNPNISSALSGMENIEMLMKNLAVANLEEAMTQTEWSKVSQAMEEIKKFSDLYCTGCNYCQPCPVGINIPRIFSIYTNHNVYGLTELAKREYKSFVSDEKNKGVEQCTECGLCEEKCPQRLKIRSELKRVDKILADL